MTFAASPNCTVFNVNSRSNVFTRCLQIFVSGPISNVPNETQERDNQSSDKSNTPVGT